uniref:Uncharacterized protein n=1 Tax=Bacteriophage sp. TaxID=38018 RepID=A0A8D9PF25_9VIRU|nr:MAG TPA: hypothetical protein [Bacteriophage sp.]
MNDSYYIYNIAQAKFIIKETQDFSFDIGLGKMGDLYVRFDNTNAVRKALSIWKNNNNNNNNKI